jgi:hypothetical protein
MDPSIAIYVDRDMSDLFGVDYYGGAGTELVIAASTLLRKGGNKYDTVHKAILEPLGNKTLVLIRRETDGPGWFGIESVV